MFDKERLADACASGSQPKNALRLHINSELTQKILDASAKGSGITLRLERAGGVTAPSRSSLIDVECWGRLDRFKGSH